MSNQIVREQQLPVQAKPAPIRVELTRSRALEARRPVPRVGPSTVRRLLFCWLRIYVSEQTAGHKAKIVNLRLPIPLPLVATLFGDQLGRERGRRGVRDDEMGLELIRVEEEKGSKRELVVIGLD